MEMMLRISYGVFVLLAAALCVAWIIWRLLKNSYDATALMFRWMMSVAILGGGYIFIKWMMGPNPEAREQIAAVLAGAVFGLMFAILWVPAIIEKVSETIGTLFTGGGEPPRPEPFYSPAIAMRKQGRFQEALYEVQQQLARFPNDVTGQMMMAEIQADEMKDLPAAQLTIERLVRQSGHTAPQIANAFNALADWHLKQLNPDAARTALEQVIARLPNTEQARLAEQRIAHLATKDHLQAMHEHRPLELREGLKDIGLMKQPVTALRPEMSPTEEAAELVKKLEQHPTDDDARERLATLYADHYQRLDLALDQFEQLVTTRNQSPKEVARWLNTMADLQVKHGVEYDTIRATLLRIVDLFPGLAVAQVAQQRIELLRLELKGKEKSQVVKLGSYEKDIGLKQPRRT